MHIKIPITFTHIVYTVLTAKNYGTVAVPPTFTTQPWSSFYTRILFSKEGKKIIKTDASGKTNIQMDAL